MTKALAITPAKQGAIVPPAMVARAGEKATRRFFEFFTANIRNPNTRAAYAQAVGQFLRWCEKRGITHLEKVGPIHVAAYIEQHPGSAPTVKQHLAAIRMLFDYWVTGQIVPTNPAASVRGPKYSAKRGKTPVLSAQEARTLLDSIKTDTVIGLRDKALLGLMCFTFARVSAAVGMKRDDYYQNGKRYWFRLHEKGGKRHEVPAHHNAETYMDAYLQACPPLGGNTKKEFIFRALARTRQLTAHPMTRIDVFRMIKRRAKAAGLPASTCCHTFRATGITAYLENGGTIENAQAIANHESPRTTKLYDHTSDQITLDEVERILI